MRLGELRYFTVIAYEFANANLNYQAYTYYIISILYVIPILAIMSVRVIYVNDMPFHRNPHNIINYSKADVNVYRTSEIPSFRPAVENVNGMHSK